ncbi:MAG: mechanosensitive ion channel domain-containing protein [Geminicoccaceae bacterium]
MTVRVALTLLLLLLLPTGFASAQGTTPPADVQQLIELLRKPDVQAWLAQPHGPAPVAPNDAADNMSSNVSSAFRHWLADTRTHLVTIRDNLGAIPGELAWIGRLISAELKQEGLWRILFLAGSLLVLGYGIQKAYWALTRSWRKHVLAMPHDTVNQRLAVVGLRLGYNLLWLASFAVSSLGAFLLFNWPPLLKTVLTALFLIIVVAGLWAVLLRFLLSPHSARLRVYPIDDASARHWQHWSVVLLSWFFGGWVAMQVLRDFDMDHSMREPIAYGLGFVLLILGLVALWRRPAMMRQTQPEHRHAKAVTVAVSILVALLWLIWVFGSNKLFWTLLVVAALPAAVRFVDQAVDHILTPPGAPTTKGPPSVVAAALERGARVFMIVFAIWLLAWGWGIDLDTLAASDTTATRLLRGVLNAIVILLVADFAWHVVRTVIDRHVHAAQPTVETTDPDEISRRSRIRTLLPILRNILMIVFAAMAVLMALSAMGVQIAPLIAGAGVIGVAVGFGSQTLVKDVISGVFFLLDDAFRVGEYIVSSSYKGTVESFSLRSIKLRHHRGSLYTVPFGSLGAVQNMSRDWVIDKQVITVPFDTDLDLVKRIVKQIGKDLLADPAVGPDILETLKMQGVDSVSELGMQVRLKMMTKPTKQFVPRRRAYAMIKKAFAENGIKFAFPTVQVAEGAVAPAVAQAALEALHKPAA